MPKRKYESFAYIMASASGTIYVGMTNDLARRAAERKEGKTDGFTQTYACHKLVYFEKHQYVRDAIGREKEIKLLRRSRKEELIRAVNPRWEDLSGELS